MRLPALLVLALPLHAGTVELRAEAEASGPYLMLGEAAVLDGDPFWADAFLAPAPEEGQVLELTREAVQARLDFLGIPAKVTGAARASVRRSAGAQVLERLRAEVAAEAARLLGRGWALAELPGLPPGWVSAEVLEATREGAEARLTVRGNGDEIRLRVPLQKVRRVAVAARDLKPSQRIGPGDLSWRDLPESSLPPGAVDDPCRCASSQLTRAVPAGGILVAAALSSPKLVARGQACVLSEASGPVRLRCQARALADGRLDDVVPFQIVDSGKTVPARVRGEGEAELRLEEAP